MPRYIRTMLPTMLCCVLAGGCGGSGIVGDATLDSIDKIGKSLDTAIHESSEWRGQSDKWRSTLENLEKTVAKEHIPQILDKVKNSTTSITSNIGDIPKEALDYAEVKLRDNLKSLRTALDNTREKIVQAKKESDAKKRDERIKMALDEFVDIKVYHFPVVTKLIPSELHIDWPQGKPSALVVEIRGWGFDRPKGEAGIFRVFFEKADGKRRPLPPGALSNTDRYKMQIKLDFAGVQFERTDQYLVFTIGQDEKQPEFVYKVTLHHREPIVPPVTPTVDRLVIKCRTIKENKEENGRVMFYVLDASNAVITKSGWYGENEDWKDDNKHKNKEFVLDIPAGKIQATGGTFTLRVQVESYKQAGITWDAIRWNADWEVILQRRAGSGYVDLQTYSLGQYETPCKKRLEDHDFAVPPPKK